ncbi:MAG: hypothetical protein AAFR66_09040 [Bacteroidota bacterium]
MRKALLLIYIVSFVICCKRMPKTNPDTIAEGFVKMCLDIDQYQPGFVDAYFGPEEFRPTEKLEEAPVQTFQATTEGLLAATRKIQSSASGDLLYRMNWMEKQLIAVKAKVEMMGGETFSFDEEAKLLYDAEPPTYTEAYFDSLLQKLDAALPGEGTVSERYQAYSAQFVIPADKLDTLFRVALAESQKRSNANIAIPADENFDLSYVTDKSWSGYNYYLGEGKSKIEINTDLPVVIDRVIDLACHEGYPGHHVFMTLLDENLYKGKGWVEYSVYPLFSPLSLVSEGAANYGIEVTFPGEERVQYEKEVLFPLAGIDPAMADEYYAIQALRGRLDYAGNEAARKYLNEEVSREEAAEWMGKYLLYSPERALQRTRFIDDYRAYVINYNLGLDMVRGYVADKGGTPDQPEKRWEVVKELLMMPKLPSELE